MSVKPLSIEAKAAAIFPSQYAIFQKILEAVQEQDHQLADSHLLALQRTIETLPDSAEAIQTRFFHHAFELRLKNTPEGTRHEENLYLLPDKGQQIQMFNFMAEKFPIVRFAQELANKHYIDAVANEPIVTIWDIGIGTGQQMLRLLENRRLVGTTMKQVRILALDPSAESLSVAHKTFAEFEERTGTPVQIHSVPKAIEMLGREDWQAIEAFLEPADGQWVANASFALHHVPPALRDSFLARVHHLNPAAFCLLEPSADFLDNDIRRRFDQAWLHYGLTFWAIDQIDAPAEKRGLLKSVFFGREIIDVIAKDANRVEQFETLDAWAKRLKKAGFQAKSLATQVKTVPQFDIVTISELPGYTAFLAQDTPLVGIIQAR